MEFPKEGTATLTAPRVPQTSAKVHGTPVTVEATQHEDGRVTLTMDPGTAATLIHYASEAMIMGDAGFRRGAIRPNDTYYAMVGSAAVRMRTVVDAVAAARFATGTRTATYDFD